MDYKIIIAERINTHANLGVENIEKLIEIPPKPEMGDYAFPCFQLAKTMRKAPNQIALDLKAQISMEGLEKIETAGGYLNFFVDKSTLLKNTIQTALSEDTKYGESSIGNGKNVCVEFSSPNIAKPFHIGHLYTTVIGNALYKMFSSQGYNAIALNHLGDWGTQFGKLIVAYERWIDMDHLAKEPIDEFLRIYVKFHEEAEKDPTLEELARQHFKNLEDGCEKETKLWKMMVDLSLNEFKKVYNMLDIHFDYFLGESFYSDKMPAVVDEIEIKGLLTESRGALVVNLDEFNIPPCMIKKSDGATLYATRDLATAIYRKKTFDFYKSVYVVGGEQKLHFRQFFSVLKKMGHDWVKDCIHVPFGLVKFADKKLSTRKGDVVLLEDLLNEAIQRSAAAIEIKNPNLEDKEIAAKKIGLGSVVFAYLKNSRERDILFNWDDILSFEGETGPYVQYTYARAKSILRKAAEQNFEINPDYSKLSSTDEFELAKLIAAFNETILMSIDKYEPSILTRYIVDVAQQFNKFYNLYPIMSCEDAELKSARLNLLKATTIVLRNGLALIGVDVVEKM